MGFNRYRGAVMRPQRQLVDHCPEEGRWGDCQRTCVAAILNMDAADVPHFCDAPHHDAPHPEHWQARQDRWLSARGLATFIVAYSGDSATFEQVMEWTSKQSPTVPCIVAGTSSRGCNHVVVVLDGEIVCDPSGSGIVGPTKENTWEVSVLATGHRVGAQAGEAGTAETVKLGSVHEHAVAESDAPKGGTA